MTPRHRADIPPPLAAATGLRRPNGAGAVAAARRGTAGFALVEAMLALVLVALVAALVLPWAGPARGRMTLDAEAQRAAAHLKAARDVAERTGSPIAVSLNPAGDALAARADGQGGSTVGGAGTLALAPGVTASLAAQGGRIVFGPGGAAEAGTLRLLFGDRSVTIAVRAFTGAVEVVP
ncbi:type II secretion system protein H [Stappia sp. 22II-S9-Z10]|nr:type II secretion system protein H [Stappia sp. 22II-S9-Z10]